MSATKYDIDPDGIVGSIDIVPHIHGEFVYADDYDILLEKYNDLREQIIDVYRGI